jgi:hypothetical protein
VRNDALGLEWDPWSYFVDDYIVEDMGAKAAFMERLVGTSKTAAYIGVYLASQLPFPPFAIMGSIGLQFMEEPGSLKSSAAWQEITKTVGVVEQFNFGRMITRLSISAAKGAARLLRHGQLSAGRLTESGITMRALGHQASGASKGSELPWKYKAGNSTADGRRSRLPKTQDEIDAVEEAKAYPENGKPVKLNDPMRDPNWHHKDGWEKYELRYQGKNGEVKVHYNINLRTEEVGDFKIK